MIADIWNDKIEWQIDKAAEAISNRDKRELAFRASMIGENAINILRLALDSQIENNFFMITMSIRKYMALGILSKDYLPFLTECYEYHRLGTYISARTSTFSFDEVKHCYDEISNLANEIKNYLKREGKM